jgi:hypothetical protein
MKKQFRHTTKKHVRQLNEITMKQCKKGPTKKTIRWNISSNDYILGQMATTNASKQLYKYPKPTFDV